MKNILFYTFLTISNLFFSKLIAQNTNTLIEINDTISWEDFMDSGNNITISNDGLVTPTNEEANYSFKSKIINFSSSTNAHEIIFKQSPVWDNWIPVSNVGPTGAGNAPVLISVKDGEYYFLGSPNGTNAYHAWESDDMINWVDRGPVTGSGHLTGRWTTTAEYKDGEFYIYYDSPNDQDPHLYIDNDLTDGIIGEDIGLAFDDPSNGSDCSAFRDDEDGLFHLIYEDWSPINARTHSWDSPLAGHTSSEDGFTGFEPHEHTPVIDHRTTPTGVFASHTHPHVTFDMNYEIHEPAQNAYGDYTTIKVGGQYYIFSDFEPVGENIKLARFTSNSLYSEFDLVGSLGNGHPDPTVGFAEGQFYLITQQSTDYVSPGPWVDGVTARAGVDTNNDGIIDNWTEWQTIKENYDHKEGYIRVVKTEDAKIDLTELPQGYGFQFEFSVDNSIVENVSPLMDRITVSFLDNTLSTTNILKNENQLSLSVSPNPTSSSLNVDLSNYLYKTVDYSIHNMLGESIKMGKLSIDNDTSVEIDLEGFKSGTYIFNVKSDNYNTSVKFIIL